MPLSAPNELNLYCGRPGLPENTGKYCLPNKIITYPANTRIGMKARKNRVLKALPPTHKRAEQANCNYYTSFIHI